MDGALPATRLPQSFEAWFEGRGWRPRPHQLAMLATARAGRHSLLIAPTGGGKTLAGFLPSLVELASGERAPDAGVHTLYLSPLKALAVDIHRNLEVPIAQMGLPIRVETRTGDTPAAKRQRQKVAPPDILLTTPEQLALFCAWEGSRAYFKDLKRVIVDEIHAFYGSKRGDLLNLGLSRLQTLAPAMQRVGLSATVNDPALLRRWLAPQTGEGETLADLVLGDPGAPPLVEVLISGAHVPWSGWTARHAMEEVYDIIKTARTTLIFVNTRFQAELAFQVLWELNDDDLPIALHHGSLAAEQRRKVEAAMGRGELRAVVCTSTLDLGIDWGAVDLVIQLAAPKGSSRLIQRIGRANHRLDEPSRAVLVPAHRFEVLECTAAQEAVAANDLDGELHRVGAQDILAQHIMGCACGEPFDANDLYAEVRSAESYRDLGREDFDRVVDFVSTGGYALRTYDRFRRIVKGLDGLWRVRNPITAQRHRMNVGAIVDIPMLSIRVASARSGRRIGGRKIGEMEEGFISQLTPGDTFLFSGQVWRFETVVGLDALVTSAPGAEAKNPSWGGAKFALSTYLASRVRRMIADEDGWGRLPADVREWLEIQRHRSIIPAEDEMLVETFRRGTRHYLVCYPFDGRISHGTLCQLLARRLERASKQPLGFVANDYGLAIWARRPLGDLDFDQLFQEDMLGDDLEAWLDESVMMKRAFRQCAVLGGLIERRFPGEEKTGRQVTFSTDLIYDVLRKHQPDHLLLRCARADAATGQLDVARLGRLLTRIRGRLRPVALSKVSPFAVPMLLEIGREPVAGAAEEAILEEN
ncbi:MAG: ligase-associated DNA damage response DEXH box helicase, partial [Caulobacteraceae bacterium]